MGFYVIIEQNPYNFGILGLLFTLGFHDQTDLLQKIHLFGQTSVLRTLWENEDQNLIKRSPRNNEEPVSLQGERLENGKMPARPLSGQSGLDLA